MEQNYIPKSVEVLSIGCKLIEYSGQAIELSFKTVDSACVTCELLVG